MGALANPILHNEPLAGVILLAVLHKDYTMGIGQPRMLTMMGALVKSISPNGPLARVI